MTLLRSLHPLRCDTCQNQLCDLSNAHLNQVKKTHILDVGRIMLMRCTTELYGCFSHSSAPGSPKKYAESKNLQQAERDRIARLFERRETLKELLVAMNNPDIAFCETGYLEYTYWNDYIRSLYYEALRASSIPSIQDAKTNPKPRPHA